MRNSSCKSIRTENSDDLYQIIEDEGIDLFTQQLPKNLSVSVKIEDYYAIGVDFSVHSNAATERTHLAHEIGHCLTDSFYSPYDVIDLRGKFEHKADTWAAHKLMPWHKLKKALGLGYTERWELADYFNVTERFVDRAFFIYRCEGKL